MLSLFFATQTILVYCGQFFTIMKWSSLQNVCVILDQNSFKVLGPRANLIKPFLYKCTCSFCQLGQFTEVQLFTILKRSRLQKVCVILVQNSFKVFDPRVNLTYPFYICTHCFPSYTILVHREQLFTTMKQSSLQKRD